MCGQTTAPAEALSIKQAHPTGTRIRIKTEGVESAHYFTRGTLATVVDDSYGRTYGPLNVLAVSDEAEDGSGGLKQRLFVADYDVVALPTAH